MYKLTHTFFYRLDDIIRKHPNIIKYLVYDFSTLRK